MQARRILSLWFPRLGAERLLRRDTLLEGRPLVVVDQIGNAQQVSSLCAQAAALGIHVGQPVRDAHAMCEGLQARARIPQAEAAFLAVLRRWAGKFSPWAAPEGDDGLVVDLTGCAHLFGGEAPLVDVIEADCAEMGLTVRAGLADTRGAAWALARFAGQGGPGQNLASRSGDAIEQEARATRSRAGKRHWTKGGTAPAVATKGGGHRIAAPGQTHTALSPLPVAALRLDAHAVAELNRLGLRRIDDVLGQPRAGLARRFGKGLVLRLDQAVGSAPEPVSPAKPPDHFAVRLTLPDPIGLEEDVMAAVDRLLPRLCERLRAKGRGARTVRLQAFRTDHGIEDITVGLARPTHMADRIRPLIALKMDQIDAGFGIDMLRLEAVQTEPLHDRQTAGHAEAARRGRSKRDQSAAVEDLIGRLGARVGLDNITRVHPASSHIPEKAHSTLAAAWSEPATGPWPRPPGPRPVLLWRPEPVDAPDAPQLPPGFRWRGQDHVRAWASGPERIAPEWWLDDPNWRSGVRDYWAVETEAGARLWLYYAHGGTMSAGWFCQGSFA